MPQRECNTATEVLEDLLTCRRTLIYNDPEPPAVRLTLTSRTGHEVELQAASPYVLIAVAEEITRAAADLDGALVDHGRTPWTVGDVQLLVRGHAAHEAALELQRHARAAEEVSA